MLRFPTIWTSATNSRPLGACARATEPAWASEASKAARPRSFLQAGKTTVGFRSAPVIGNPRVGMPIAHSIGTGVDNLRDGWCQGRLLCDGMSDGKGSELARHFLG